MKERSYDIDRQLANLSVFYALFQDKKAGIDILKIEANKCYILKTESGEFVSDIVYAVKSDSEMTWVESTWGITGIKHYASEVVAGPFDNLYASFDK